MSFTLTSRYALGAGPLREALSQLVAERLGHGGESKRASGGVHVRAELLDIFDACANMEAMLVSLAIARGGDEWGQTFSQKRICSVSLRPVTPVRKMLMSGFMSSGVSYCNCGGLWFLLFAANA